MRWEREWWAAPALLVVEVEEFSGDFGEVVGLAVLGGLFEGGFGVGQELVDGAVEELSDFLAAFLGQRGEVLAGEGAGEFGVFDLSGGGFEVADEGAESLGAEKSVESGGAVADDLLGVFDGLAAAFEVLSGEALEVVDVVEVDVDEFADGGFDVARDGEIDQEHGAAAAFGEGAGHGRDAEDRVGGVGGADDDVGPAEVVVEEVDLNGFAVVAIGEGAAAFEGTVEDQDVSDTAGDEVLEGEFAGLAGADDHDGFGGQVAEDFFGEFDGDGADGDPSAADVGLAVDALGDGECLLEERVEQRPGGGGFGGGEVGLLDLSEDFGFADDHGVEAGGDGEEVFDGLEVLFDVAVVGRVGVEGFLRVAGQDGPESRAMGGDQFAGGVEFGSVAGGKEDELGVLELPLDPLEDTGDVVFAEGEFFAEGERGGSEVHAGHDEVHVLPPCPEAAKSCMLSVRSGTPTKVKRRQASPARVTTAARRPQ